MIAANGYSFLTCDFVNLRFVNSYTTLRVDGQPMIERQLEMEKQPKKKLDEILTKILQVAVDHSLQVAHFSSMTHNHACRIHLRNIYRAY